MLVAAIIGLKGLILITVIVAGGAGGAKLLLRKFPVGEAQLQRQEEMRNHLRNKQGKAR